MVGLFGAAYEIEISSEDFLPLATTLEVADAG